MRRPRPHCRVVFQHCLPMLAPACSRTSPAVSQRCFRLSLTRDRRFPRESRVPPGASAVGSGPHSPYVITTDLLPPFPVTILDTTSHMTGPRESISDHPRNFGHGILSSDLRPLQPPQLPVIFISLLGSFIFRSSGIHRLPLTKAAPISYLILSIF
ncbi:hypothetical protein HDK77DRAFT_213929 [Phyllosticta capitalensis]|uniref:Uncharacterized protein n=1 Tax=Phyllosticta capitalensis TaxID=121624 RepID=A0ABR1Z3M3_9PEZI